MTILPYVNPSPPTVTDRPVWFNTAEAAAILGYRSRNTVLRMIHAGELRARRRGNTWRIPAGELDRLRSTPEAPR